MTAAPWPLLYSAYEYIKANVAPETSNTARLLRAPNWAKLRARLADELEELAGVITGAHHHKGMPDDLILEASQVCYWTFVQAVAANYALTDITPATPIIVPPNLTLQLRQLAAAIGTSDQPLAIDEARAAWALALACCQSNGIDPAAPCLYDLEQMRGRSYMQPYFTPH